MLNGNSRTADKFVVRLPDGMREQIADIALRNHRSMNSEIIGRLEDSIASDYPVTAAIDHGHLTKDEQAMILAVRGLAPSKRKALLVLLAPDQ